jgi:serpin B
VRHKAWLGINEKGTEAAAATVVGLVPTDLPIPKVSIRFDHPFVFFIRDVQTGAILFLGRVVDPSAT